MSPTRTNRIILQNLNLKGSHLRIPVADLTTGETGPTILITAGLDGDEYTGIRAAYELIEYYSQVSFTGRIIIVPIVNAPGFYAGMSKNPIDGKYPKYTYPGKRTGSATEQLLDWLHTNFVIDAAVWLDLHSGAITERLQPFIWGFDTRKKEINLTTQSVFQALSGVTLVYEKAPFLSKADRLAARGCVYLVYECGERGGQTQEAIDTMVSWVKQTIAVIHGEKVTSKPVSCFQRVSYYRAPFAGMWFPSVDPGAIEKGEDIGHLQTLDLIKKEGFTANEQGQVLWVKSALFAQKYDELVAIAHSQRIL